MPVLDSGRLLAGRYRLGAVIGRGGMGVVWRARDELLARDVAVKEIILPPELEDSERDAGRRRAVREAQMAARLRHPNVVGVYDIIEDDGRPAIVMELVPFPSLHDTIRDHGPLPPAQVARIGLGVLAGLRAAHEAGVVHRDVKPTNILLSPEDRSRPDRLRYRQGGRQSGLDHVRDPDRLAGLPCPRVRPWPVGWRPRRPMGPGRLAVHGGRGTAAIRAAGHAGHPDGRSFRRP